MDDPVKTICATLVTLAGMALGYLKIRDTKTARDLKARVEALESREKQCQESQTRLEADIRASEANVSRLEREVRELEHQQRTLQQTVISKQEIIDRLQGEQDQKRRGGGTRH